MQMLLRGMDGVGYMSFATMWFDEYMAGAKTWGVDIFLGS